MKYICVVNEIMIFIVMTIILITLFSFSIAIIETKLGFFPMLIYLIIISTLSTQAMQLYGFKDGCVNMLEWFINTYIFYSSITLICLILFILYKITYSNIGIKLPIVCILFVYVCYNKIAGLYKYYENV
jgi:hypothetical protein